MTTLGRFKSGVALAVLGAFVSVSPVFADQNTDIIKNGLLGAGVGAISAEASGGKAGKGALIGAGVNVIGGALLNFFTGSSASLSSQPAYYPQQPVYVQPTYTQPIYAQPVYVQQQQQVFGGIFEGAVERGDHGRGARRVRHYTGTGLGPPCREYGTPLALPAAEVWVQCGIVVHLELPVYAVERPSFGRCRQQRVEAAPQVRALKLEQREPVPAARAR